MSTRARQLSAATAAALLGLPVAAAVASHQEVEGNAATLREKLILSEAAIKGLTESLAVANGEAELFKRKSDDLGERIEALGLQTGDDSGSMRTRLLAAVRDVRVLQKENEEARGKLITLTESVLELLKSSEGIDAKHRMRVEASLRSASGYISGSAKSDTVAPGLTTGRVVDTKPDLALVVANLGSRQGVRTGMPFQVWRDDHLVATVRVVDVRDAVSGAIVQNTSEVGDTVRTGDSLRIDTTR